MALIKCPECGKEISSSAGSCPNCGHPINGGEKQQTIVVKEKKKGSCLGKILIVFIIFVAIGFAAAQMGDDSNSGRTTSRSETSDQKETEPIEYTSVTVNELMSDLDSNAMNASDKYKGKYLEVTGKLSNIDSSGKYIDLVPDEDFAIIGIQCYIKNNEQKEAIKSMNIGDTVTVRGKCTDVGEVLGYSLDIESVG